MLGVFVFMACGTAETEAPPTPPPAPVEPAQRPDRRQGAAMACDAAAMLMAVKVSGSVDASIKDQVQGSDPMCQGRFGRLVVGAPGQDSALALMKFEGGAWRVLDFGTGLDTSSCAEKTNLPQEVCEELTALPH